MSHPEQELQQQPGLLLQRARQRAGLSRSYVAEQLKLFVSQVEALELGQYDRLPGELFICGYLRGYANLLNLKADELVALYKKQQPVKEVELVELAVSPSSTQSMISQHRQHKTGYGLVLSLVVVFGLWWYNDKPEVPTLDSGTNLVRVDTEQGTTLVGPLMEYSNGEIDIAAKSTVPFQSSLEMNGSATFSRQGLALDEGLADAQSQLSFYFTGDCWVEVRDGDDKIIYANLKRADDELNLHGKPPFRVTLGYAPAVSLSFNGEPVDIESHRRDNMAKFTLGNS